MGRAQQQTGAAFEDAVIELARLSGWKVAHFRAARTTRGWRNRLIFAECKAGKARLSAHQEAWKRDLEGTGASYHLFSDQDWPAIERVLCKGQQLRRRTA